MTENEARQDLPAARIVAVTERGSRAFLVLAVNIEGQDHEIVLELDASAMTNATSREGEENILRRLANLEKVAQNHNQNFRTLLSVLNGIPEVRRQNLTLR